MGLLNSDTFIHSCSSTILELIKCGKQLIPEELFKQLISSHKRTAGDWLKSDSKALATGRLVKSSEYR